MIEKIELQSVLGRSDYPRLQYNKYGSIILALSKDDILTTGIKVGNKENSTCTIPIGTRFVDWEVGGELFDYDGEVNVVLSNLHTEDI